MDGEGRSSLRGDRREAAARHRHIQAAVGMGGAAAVIFLIVGAMGLARLVKEGGPIEPPPLVAIEVPPAIGAITPQPGAPPIDPLGVFSPATTNTPQPYPMPTDDSVVSATSQEPADMVRFNGRSIRPSHILHMRVTAYSPDARSTAPFNDDVTASGFSIWTNGGMLVAADTSVLPFGSLVSIPGYDDGLPVPVLDRGGAIKGYRLDVMFPTHEAALEWGVRWLDVTMWEYADEVNPVEAGLSGPDAAGVTQPASAGERGTP